MRSWKKPPKENKVAEYYDALARMMVERGVPPSEPDDWTARDKNPFLHLRDGAVPVPSYQRAFAITIDGDAGRDLENLPKHLKSSTFLNPMRDPGEACYWYPRCLYSVVDDAEKPEEFLERIRWMVNLSKWAEVTFDSGGYHIALGRVHWTSARKLGTLRLSEDHAHFAMTFDHPTFTGHPFNNCLEETVRNLNWLLKRREGRCKWLNVCQGSTVAQALAWWLDIKFATFAGLEGLAFAVLGMNAWVLLSLMRQQIDDGAFDNLERCHALGKMKPTDMVLYTIIKRIIRKHFNPDFQFTADSAVAFREAGQWSQFYDGLVDDSGSFGSSVFSKLLARDANSKLPPDTEIYLNSPVYPKGVPILMREIGQINWEGKQTSNRLGMSMLAANNMWHQITQIINAQEEVDAVLHLPKFHRFSEVNTDVLLMDVVNSLRETGSVKSADAQLLAALRQIDQSGNMPGVQFFKHHDMEIFPVLQDVVEQILVGERPDVALREHRELLESWF